VKTNNTFHLVSLGCPKNRVDSERILSTMAQAGFLHVHDPVQAGVIVINTCAFIESAVEESIDTILDHREDNREAFLVVAGCLPSRYGESLEEPLPEVDLFLRPDQIDRLPAILAADASREYPRGAGTSTQGPRILTTPGYAYLKIAEGCSRHCSYCTIPSIRGALRSSEVSELEGEARWLASMGVRELILVAQDLTRYGLDRKKRSGLLGLLDRLTLIDGIRWIRLMYLHPEGIPKGLADTINESPKILPYLDIPFQHVSPTVLRAMGRPWKGDAIRKLVDSLRSSIPGLVLRTTFMVGFPGEGDQEYGELLEFVESYGIDRVGVFTYSPEEGTPAFDLGDSVPQEVKDARAEEIQSVHARFLRDRNRAKIGCIEPAIVEGVSAESELLLQGRMWDQAPEIDGVLYVTDGCADAGEIYDVRITGSHGPDIFCELLEP
jgi:ribosomal protein S12 methylthiotransferase